MKLRKSIQHMGIVLTLLILVGCTGLNATPTPSPTPEFTPTPDMTPGEVKGVFVDKVTGEPLELIPVLLLLTEGMTEAEIDEFKNNET